MKRLLLLFAFMLAAIFGILYVLSGSESDSEGIILESKETIYAGDEWLLSLTIDDASAGDTVDVTLLNGLQTFNESLVLGTGGVAVWKIPEGQIIQAGESLIIVQFNDKVVKRSLTIQAGKPTEGVLFTSVNALPAYGEGSATVMFLAQDEWGNIPSVSRPLYLNIRYPDGSPPQKEVLTYHDGIGRFYLNSQGQSGRIRLAVDQGLISTDLELTQTAGAPNRINLAITPDCVLNDGRDVITLKADVSDQNQYPVANGTFVTFLWSGGLGYGRTNDGTATLTIPAPNEIGYRLYRASTGSVLSKSVSIQVTGDSCS